MHDSTRLAFALAAAAALLASPAPARADDPPETVMVPMRDGVELATDLYLPKTRDGEKCPTILVRTPYGRRNINTAARVALARGFAIAVQDLRGRGDSKGDRLPFAGSGFGERGDDGADTIRWIARRPWSSGRVGTYGPSALGIVQNFTAVAAPEGLSAQWIEVAAASLYHHAAYPGGVLREEQIEGWTRENRFDLRALELMRSHPLFDKYWRELDTLPHQTRANTPATHVGGWFDSFVEGTIDAFSVRQADGAPGARGRQRLIVGPWTHGGRGKLKQGELELPEAAARMFPQSDPLRWFGRWLKDEENGVEKDPAVTYYVLGANEWRTASAWPPAPTEARAFYLRGTGELSTEAPAAAEPERGFAHDPKDPSPTRGGRNLNIAAGPFDQRAVEARKDALVWTTAPLERSVEVAGAVRAKLHAASSKKDMDVHVRLTDVDEDGRSLLVLDGARRASLREGFERPLPLAPGEAVALTVELGSIAYRFKAGHRIRVVVSGANAPRYAAFPEAVDGKIYAAPGRASAIELPVLKDVKVFR